MHSTARRRPGRGATACRHHGRRRRPGRPRGRSHRGRPPASSSRPAGSVHPRPSRRATCNPPRPVEADDHHHVADQGALPSSRPGSSPTPVDVQISRARPSPTRGSPAGRRPGPVQVDRRPGWSPPRARPVTGVAVGRGAQVGDESGGPGPDCTCAMVVVLDHRGGRVTDVATVPALDESGRRRPVPAQQRVAADPGHLEEPRARLHLGDAYAVQLAHRRRAGPAPRSRPAPTPGVDRVGVPPEAPEPASRSGADQLEVAGSPYASLGHPGAPRTGGSGPP